MGQDPQRERERKLRQPFTFLSFEPRSPETE